MTASLQRRMALPMTRPGYGLQVSRLLETAIDFSLVHSAQTGCGPPSFLFSEFLWLSWKYSGRNVKLTTHLHLVLSLRMRAAIPLLPDLPLCCEQWQLCLWGIRTSTIQCILTEYWVTEVSKQHNVISFKCQNVLRLLDIYTPKIKRLRYLETSGTQYPVTQAHIPEEWIPHPQCCENL
jgi:hypothetical protein